jgi:hypothetical protein
LKQLRFKQQYVSVSTKYICFGLHAMFMAVTMAANASEAANMAATMAANMAANTGAADWPDSYSEQFWFDKYLNHVGHPGWVLQ